MNPSFEVIVFQQNGWWSVMSPELEISGFGDSEAAAKAAFERSLISTVMANLRGSLSEEPQQAGEDLPEVARVLAGQLVRRTRVMMGGQRPEGASRGERPMADAA
jgi:hypothetical protein